MVLIALSAALGFLVLGNARVLIQGYEQGRPSLAQLTGSWTSHQGATLKVLPDGTFMASGLPADRNDPVGKGTPQAGGHGTWQITRGDGTWYALFTFSDGPQFRLDDGDWTGPGEAGTAWFSYIFPQYNAIDLWAFYRP